MSQFTSRLNLQQPIGTDAPSALRDSINANTAVLDGGVVTATGTLAARPAASTVPAGNEYYATDVGQWARSDGTNWHTYLSAGDLRPSAAATAPAGWLLCDGTAYSRSTYAALFTNIGTTYGAGDGTTTFNVPDYRGRVILGAGSGGTYTDLTTGVTKPLTARSRGQMGGEEAHTLADSELPGDVYIPSAGDHLKANNAFVYETQPGYTATDQIYNPGGSAHGTMPPFGVASVLIKT